MKPFIREAAIAAPLDRDNIDTDQILPARYLMMPRDENYKTYAFRDLRYRPDGSEKPDFILNQSPFRGATILVAGKNFGCGSSREGAVFTLVDAGVRAVIAPSFGDIFFNNACNNGLLPVVLDDALATQLRRALHDDATAQVSIDLEAMTISGPGGFRTEFKIDPHRRERLLKGLDSVGYTLQFTTDIEKFEAAYRQEYGWRA